jgi:hypothetical protein
MLLHDVDGGQKLRKSGGGEADPQQIVLHRFCFKPQQRSGGKRG